MAVRWFSMSTQFLADPKIESLGEKHGSAGPLVIVALLGRAKIEGNGGRVTCSFRTLAHESFADRSDLPEIVASAADNGLIEIEELTDTEVSARFPAFSRWQEAGRKAEERQAKKPTPQANVRTRPEVSGSVPTDKTRQDREEKTTTAAVKAAKPAPDEIPDDFPADFTPILQAVRPILERVAETKGSKPIRNRPLCAALTAHPDRNHIESAGQLEHWCFYGVGEKKTQKDVVALYRNFLKRAEPMPTPKATKPAIDYDAKTEVYTV